ncbi:MAG: PhoPQ-activated protein PqaA family protein [Candidatus Hydrogenedentes bacterium]|nr:PhoPQ-activated protein PqaA family protein [Candidatus Hydrogenedentota bacterium]
MVESPGAVAETVQVYADALLVPDFTADNRSPQPGELVRFTDLMQSAEGPVTSHEWHFGDGTKSAAQNPTHIFDQERAYQVSLKVSTANRTETAVRKDYILAGGQGPIADFTATPLTLFQGETVKFTDRSSSGLGQIKSWAWTFGDGGTSTSPSPYHTYEAAGKYTVSLTVGNDYGSHTETKQNYVFVQSKVAPVAAFVYGSPYVNQYIQFTDVSMSGSKPITDWRWNFGDPGGLLNISTQRNPKYMYTSPGTYRVSLTVSTDHGTSTTGQDVVAVYAPLTADFTVNRTRSLVDDTIIFTDTSLFGSMPITSREWDFGDGTTSTGTQPIHKYQAPGTYSVKLTVSTAIESHTATKAGLISVFERRPLDDFMRRADANYRYELKRTVNNYGVTGYILLMTSQQWRTEEEVTPPLWKHWVTLLVPPNITNNTALLMVSGGDNADAQAGSPTPSTIDETLAHVAIDTGSVVVVLNQVPSENLKFADEFDDRYVDVGRDEDEIIAYTYNKFFETYAAGEPDPTWPLLLPMAKSAVRAMDTVQDFMKKLSTPVTIKDFVVTGASKRGWTTWLTGVYDHRVRAIAPIVIDVLNMDAQMDHHRTSYGFYSEAIEDYVDLFIFEHFDSDEGQALLKIVDPYEYRERLIMPKLMINSTGDEFFLPDSAQFYFHDLLGMNHITYAPNTNHGMGGYQNVISSLVPWYKGVVEQRDLPVLSWVAEDTRITAHTETTPEAVLLWTATSPTRDFRNNTDVQPNPPVWTSTALEPSGVNLYIAEPTRSATAWTGFFIQFKFDSGMIVEGQPAPYIVSTECRVAPPTLPVAPNVNFYANKVRAQKNEVIQFTDLTQAGTSSVSTWEWSFGDGGTSNLRDPDHAYTLPGTYTVTLTARSLAGEDTLARTNYITIEEPTGPQPVPNVVGMTLQAARDAIEAAGFTAGAVTGQNSTTVEKGRIISQEPAGGEVRQVGTAVSLVQSLGPVTVECTVPDIVGMTEAEARAAIIAAGLTVVDTIYESSPQAEGTVIRQDPAAGESVPEGTPVNIWVSIGAGTTQCTVPDVYNLTQAQAETAIRGANLLVGTISQLASLDVAIGNVMMQFPAAGTKVQEGSKVNITVSLGPQYTELDRYLAKRTFPPEYTESDVVDMGSATAYVLNMKSQDWLTTAEVNRPEWRHWLSVVVPHQVQSTTALLVVSDGNYLTPDNMPDWNNPGDEMPYLKWIAVLTSSVVAMVEQVPVEPLMFQDEQVQGEGEHWRTEDEIIAYSYDKYLTTGDPKWPALFPMTMSAVRAMDTIQDYSESSFVEDFVVTGASKRGWTTWLTGAADNRVRALVPTVIDVLNMGEQMAHQYNAYNGLPPSMHVYGGYSDEVHDYVDSNVFARFDTPLGQELLKLVDPYEYRNRLYMPKLILNSTGDQFFLPDSSQFYIADLPGETALRYIPNTNHGMGDGTIDVVYSIATFFQAQLMGGRTPRYPWTFEGTNKIRVTPITSAQSAKLWFAQAPYERDFRLTTRGAIWESQNLVRDNLGDYVGQVPDPVSGWTGFFVELMYQSPVPNKPYVFTTPVRVIPDLLGPPPYPEQMVEYPDQIYREQSEVYKATLKFKVNGPQGVVSLPVQVEMNPPSFSVPSVDFGTEDVVRNIRLVNSGDCKLDWFITMLNLPRWLRMDGPENGTIKGGDSALIQIRGDRTIQLTVPAWFTHTLPFNALPWPDIGIETHTSTILMEVPSPVLVYEPDNPLLDYGASLTELSFRFWSDTLCDMTWGLAVPEGTAGVEAVTIIQVNDQPLTGKYLYTSNGGLGSEEARDIDHLTDPSYHGWQYKSFRFKVDRSKLEVGYYNLPYALTTSGGNVTINLKFEQSYPPQYPK